MYRLFDVGCSFLTVTGPCVFQLREAQGQLEEFQTANYHLQKRIDKMKSGRNAYK